MKYKLLVILCCVCSVVYGKLDAPTLRATLLAIEQVESHGNTRILNRRALGCMQITPIALRDCNRILGYTKYTLEDRKDRAKSFAIAKIILDHYGDVREFRTGKKVSVRFMANVWRYGYRAACSTSLRSDYANRVSNLVGLYRR